jgi:hypothetical protein
MRRTLGVLIALAVTVPAAAADLKDGLQKGTPTLKSAGALAFAPEGILFVADTKDAAIYAIATNDQKGDASQPINVEKIDAKVAALLGSTPQDVTINDIAVNPASGTAYLSVSRGNGPRAAAVILTVNSAGKLDELSLENVMFAKATLPNAPADAVQGEGRRRGNPRTESITDLAYDNGYVVVAGLSNEEFASKLRSIPFPFQQVAGGTSVEIFHGAHGQYETRSPVRTFTMFRIDGEPHVLAAYTCTPLVTFPLSDLSAESGKEKVRGTTVAELGNQNRPLDMIVYNKGDKSYLLMANDRRGVMKVSTEDLDRSEGITEKVSGTAGQEYETLETLKGVVQLDKLNDRQALLLVETEEGQNLQTFDLP